MKHALNGVLAWVKIADLPEEKANFRGKLQVTNLFSKELKGYHKSTVAKYPKIKWGEKWDIAYKR